MDKRPVQERANAVKDQIFLGGTPHVFERVGRMQLAVLLENGLQPWSKVLDFGCGALRGGWWMMQFLLPGHYCGIEPNKKRLQLAIDHIAGPDLIARAQPRFSSISDLNMGVFGESWDFVICRSIWTHASKSEIGAMMGSFRATSAPKGRMLTSVLPAGERWPDFNGPRGLTSNDQRAVAGTLAHDLGWIKTEAAKQKLSYKLLDARAGQNQRWVVLRPV